MNNVIGSKQKMASGLKILFILLIGGVGIQPVFAQQNGTFIDSRDGKKYQTVKVGKQNWMAQNLDYHGEDGNLGLCYSDKERKRKAKVCSKKYGRLYSWEEANKACPKGWHLPNDTEWQKLIDFVGGDKIAGTKLKASEGWEVDRAHCQEDQYVITSKDTIVEIDELGKATYKELKICSNSTDEFGFTALPGGGGNADGFVGTGYVGTWWSATEHESYNDYAFCRYMDYLIYDVIKYMRDKTLLFSVRCVQD